MEPKDIANLINEDLFGYHTSSGAGTELDQLIEAVDAHYMDWDIRDPEFQALFCKIYRDRMCDSRKAKQYDRRPHMRVYRLWRILGKDLIQDNHGQNPQLGSMLFDRTAGQWAEVESQLQLEKEKQQQQPEIEYWYPEDRIDEDTNGHTNGHVDLKKMAIDEYAFEFGYEQASDALFELKSPPHLYNFLDSLVSRDMSVKDVLGMAVGAAVAYSDITRAVTPHKAVSAAASWTRRSARQRKTEPIMPDPYNPPGEGTRRRQR